jgi:2-methylcitrate dehydratase PrpD
LHAEVSKVTWPLCCEPVEQKWAPTTDAEAQFSLPYVLSVVAHEGRFLVDEFGAPTQERADIRGLMAATSAAIGEALGDLEARITITRRDGSRLSGWCDDVPGSPTRRFTDDEWRARFAALARHSVAPPPGSAIDQVLDALFALDRSTDVEQDVFVPLSPRT